MSANNFQLTLDTIAPVGSITYPNSLANIRRRQDATDITLTMTKGDAIYMKVWFDGTQTATTIPPDTGEGAVPWLLATTSYDKNFDTDGSYYGHVVFIDDVGNASPIYNTALIIVDTQPPAVTSFYAYDLDDTADHAFVNGNQGLDRKFGIHIEAADTGTVQSGLKEVRISGNFEEKDTGKSYKTVQAVQFANGAWSGTLTFNANLADTTTLQSFTVVAEDNSGNTVESSCSIVFDPVQATASYAVKADKNDSTTLPTYVNSTTNSFDVTINASDVAPGELEYYQLYGDIYGHTTATNITWPNNSTAIIHIEDLRFLNETDNVADGNRTVHVVIADKAGNITTPLALTWVYDHIAPTGSIYTDKNTPGTPDTGEVWISSGSGAGRYSSITVHYTASDATSGLDPNYPKFYCNNTLLTGISSESFTFSYNTSGAVIGENVIRMDLKDRSGNEYSTNCKVYIEEGFEIDDLDLTGWALYENVFNGTNKTNISAVVTNTVAPAAGRSVLYVWIDQTEDNETVPNTASPVDWTSSPQTVAYNNMLANFAESANNYLHVKAVSTVGNFAFAHSRFTVDETAPTFNLTVERAHTPNRSNNVIVSIAADDLSGLDKVKLVPSTGTTLGSGSFDWTLITAAASTGAGQTYSVAVSNETVDGIYSVEVLVRDRANNVTTHNISWEFDKTRPGVTLTLLEADGATEKLSPTALQTFKAQIAFTVPDNTDTFQTVWYQIYGDISTAADGSAITYDNSIAPGEQGSAWKTFSSNTIITPTYYCTQLSQNADADGETKTIYVILIDDAGNTSLIQSASFIYNPRVAELKIDQVSYDRISCTHRLRKTSSGSTVTNLADYADKVSFRVTCEQTITEWKVAAYTTYPDEEITGDLITPMSMHENGSSTSGYHQSNVSVKQWNVQIDGTDFRAALGGSDQVNKDGIHYVIVFGKNLAGTWSIAGVPYDETEDGLRGSWISNN